MNSRAFTLSLVISFVAMWMVYAYVEGQKTKMVKVYGNPLPVVVAKENINELDLLDDTNLTITTIPKKYRAPGAFKRPEDVFNKFAAVPILKGEQITSTRVLNPGAKTGLSRQISVGKRAISIPVSDMQAVGKLIRPGDRVDILSMVDYSGGQKNRQKVKTLMQDIYVLSTGLSVTNTIPLVGMKNADSIRKMNLNTYTNFNTITLEVDPNQAQKLFFLQNSDPIILVLRNNNDKTITSIKSTTIFDVLGVEDKNEAKEFFAKKAAGGRKRK